MSAAGWLALLVTWAIAVASPGPDFVAVLRSGAAYGRRDALLVGAGVVSGIACWILLAITGIGAVLAAHAGLYVVLRVVGAVVLVGYGLVILWHSRQAAGATAAPQEHVRRARSGLAAYRLGLATNLANPKALVFFGALLASLLPPSPDAALRLEVMVAMLSLAAAWFALTALATSSAVVVRAYDRARTASDRVLGTVFVGLGATLLGHS